MNTFNNERDRVEANPNWWCLDYIDAIREWLDPKTPDKYRSRGYEFLRWCTNFLTLDQSEKYRILLTLQNRITKLMAELMLQYRRD